MLKKDKSGGACRDRESRVDNPFCGAGAAGTIRDGWFRLTREQIWIIVEVVFASGTEIDQLCALTRPRDPMERVMVHFVVDVSVTLSKNVGGDYAWALSRTRRYPDRETLAYGSNMGYPSEVLGPFRASRLDLSDGSSGQDDIRKNGQWR